MTHTDALRALLERVYYRGWCNAARWAGRDDLAMDEGSAAYVRDREPCIESALSGVSAPEWLGVVDELLTNIKRSCVRGRNAADPTPENSSFIATFDHIEDLAQQAQRALSRVSAPVGVERKELIRAARSLRKAERAIGRALAPSAAAPSPEKQR